MARKVMFQGTASNVGKSIISAGICRIFYQDGHKVAPFKPQNMALNSFITKEGLEIGRAQAFQAEAANISPKAIMNPILLKPSGEQGSQVVVLGKVVGNMNSVEYENYKLKLIEILKDSFKRLSDEYDIVVMEGAGSTAEINLKDNDISNMKMAELAEAPVVIISDIDRGGVFASIVGTLALLNEDERARVKGVIINKFRGKKELLQDGVEMLEKIIKIPVLGVIPYSDIKIEDEDSVTNRFKNTSVKNDVNIEIIRTPFMSNFTDFDIFETQGDVSVRYIGKGEYLSNPDIVIIPGSKNTVEDLKYIRQSGLEDQILYYSKKGGLVVGICGGYQILGKKILDPNNVESIETEMDGLGLLDICTIFNKDKCRTQVEAKIDCERGQYLKGLSEKKVSGYEIHMGETTLNENSLNLNEIVKKLDKEVRYKDGCVNSQGSVFGTYIHGIFDDVEFTRTLLNNIRELKGLDRVNSSIKSYKDYKDKQYDELAGFLRENLDINKIYEILC